MKFLKNLDKNRLSFVAVLLIVAVIPFNIVYHFDSTYAYIDGAFVNYLDFVVHIIDVAAVVAIVCIVIAAGFYKDKNFWLVIGTGLAALVVHNLFFLGPVVLYFSFRLFLYFVCGFTVYMYMAGIKLKEKKKLRRSITWVVASVAAFQSTLGILQFFLNRSLGLVRLGESVIQVGGYDSSSVYLVNGYHLRAYGTFPHPNILGGFLTIALIPVIHTLSKERGRRKVLLAFLLLVILVGILLTWSRSAWLVSGLSVAIYLGVRIYRASRKYFWVYLCGVFVFLGVVGSWVMLGSDFLSSSIRERVVNQSTGSDVSVVERKELTYRAFKMIKESWLTGVGMGNFINELSDNPVYKGGGIRLMQPVHNVFLLVMSEVGLLGVILFAGVGVVWRKVVSCGKSPKVCPLDNTKIYVAMSVLLLSLVDHYFWSLPQGLGLIVLALLI
ncbi:O-antigen ligase family protein [Candidatus Dojkabacteria bacterium]|nr:O-antigen ligase family protein [Candidatus Dojkabacteria bacterium]